MPRNVAGMDRSGRRIARSILVVLLLIPALLFFRSGKGKRSAQRPRQSTEYVSWVIDGDTLRLKNRERIRLLSIDAPEMRKGKPGHSGPFPEPGAQEATAFLKKLVEGRTVKVVRHGCDRYQRTLALIYLEDGTDVCAELLKRGLVRRWGRR
jgi:micrococcal nuclease